MKFVRKLELTIQINEKNHYKLKFVVHLIQKYSLSLSTFISFRYFLLNYNPEIDTESLLDDPVLHLTGFFKFYMQ